MTRLINTDRYEIDTRTKIKEIIEVYQMHADLFGIPKEVAEDITIIRDDGLSEITAEIYELLIKEMKKNDTSRGPTEVD